MDLAHHFQGLGFLWQRVFPPLGGGCTFTVLGVSFLLSILSSWAQATLLTGPAWQTNPLGVGFSHGHLAKDTEVRLIVDAALEFWSA